VLSVEDRPTGRERGPEAVVASIIDFACHLAERVPPVAAVGVVVPGLVDEVRGTAVYSANIGWRDVPLRDLLARRIGPDVPVVIGHDVRAGGLAESVVGAGRGADDLLFLPVGTGIAAAMIIRGEPYPGASGWGGEIGHLVVRPGGEPCACGNRGCLETYASAAAIARRYAAPGEKVSAEGVVARMVSGDPRAVRVWDEAVDALADALAAYAMLLDPGLIVLGGGLAASGDLLLRPLGERLAERLPIRAAPPMTTAALGVRASMIGAALLAWRDAGGGRDAVGA
jgi:glucokinase